MNINPIQIAKEQIENVVIAAVDSNVDLPKFTIEKPANSAHGDFSTNAAMVWAKSLQNNPRAIATEIIENIKTDGTYISSAEIAGPGFINFRLHENFYTDLASYIISKGVDFGKSAFGEEKRVLVEFVSANPTGPMHIGNARGGALGDGIASALEWAGFNVSREFYINDAGNQLIKFGASLEARYLQIFDDSIEFPEDGYKGADITEHAENFAKIHHDKYVNADENSRKQALVEYALPLNVKRLEDNLERYRIIYDNWFKESSLHKGGEVSQIIEKLKESGKTYEHEGALWLMSGDEQNPEEDFVVVRANGVPTYLAADIAYHYNKFVTRDYDVAINVLGADHHGYKARLVAGMSALGLNNKQLDFKLTQMVRLIRGGEVIKSSKRTGKSITLETLLDEIPLDAARYFFNLREADTHLDFDLDLAIEESSKNPVYYVQYAHARICSIIKNLAAEGIEIDKNADLSLLNHETERDLILKLADFESEIIMAAQSLEPAKIAKYVFDLAALFHKFYNAVKVRCDDLALSKARLLLCDCARIVIKNSLTILKVDAPEMM